MPNRGTLNWNSSNTTYNIQPGYYSGGTLDSRTSYTNGYNTGYNKGKEEGGSSINIGSTPAVCSTVRMPNIDANSITGFKSVYKGVAIAYARSSNQEYYFNICKLHLPKNNPSKVYLSIYDPDGEEINVSYSRSTSIGGSSNHTIKGSPLIYYHYRSDARYPTHYANGFYSLLLTPTSSWKTIARINRDGSYYSDGINREAKIEYRLENSNTLTIRAFGEIVTDIGKFLDTNHTGFIHMRISTDAMTSFGPYGPATINGFSSYLNIVCY